VRRFDRGEALVVVAIRGIAVAVAVGVAVCVVSVTRSTHDCN
jgi:hypothetical protein